MYRFFKFVVGSNEGSRFQVAPAELEALLMTHPRIRDAAVVGVLREDGITEVPRAYVVPKSEPEKADLSAAQVYSFARERLIGYKALNGGIRFVDQIPRTASGKIQRFRLQETDGESTESGSSSSRDAEAKTNGRSVAVVRVIRKIFCGHF